MQREYEMRALALLLLVTACAESVNDRVERLTAEADMTCWYHRCTGGPGSTYNAPKIPIEQGVACMNDALASGGRAVAWWAAESASTGYDARGAYYFTVDHQVEVFTSHEPGMSDPVFTESPSCTGPFQIGPSFCAAGPDQNGTFVEVMRIDVVGCP